MNKSPPKHSRYQKAISLSSSLMTPPKHSRYSNDDSPSSSRVSISNPNQSTMDTLIESLILSFTDHASINDSFDRILESISTDSEQNHFIQRAIDIGSVLLEAGNRSRRKRASAHNAFVWPLPDDVTVKVFSLIDTQSMCNAAATCSLFNKCAMDPLCYGDINLVTLVPKVNDAGVSTMIQRAGNALHSIKLGIMPEHLWPGDVIDSPILTSSCLSSLNGNRGALGLRRLHLFNIEGMDNTALSASLAVCPSLRDLEIVCLYVDWKLTLESVSKHIPLIERLICESCSGGMFKIAEFLRGNSIFAPSVQDDHHGLEYSTCSKFIRNCPNITTLALKGFEMPDSLARKLVKGFRKLTYVDFSNTYLLTGSFLKNLSTNGGGKTLEVMILRNTTDLKRVRVRQFLEALLAGAWRSLRHLDISHDEGLASKHDWADRRHSTSFIPIKQLLEQRPNFRLLAEFGKSDSSDGSLYMSTSGSSYISVESSDDVDS